MNKLFFICFTFFFSTYTFADNKALEKTILKECPNLNCPSANIMCGSKPLRRLSEEACLDKMISQKKIKTHKKVKTSPHLGNCRNLECPIANKLCGKKDNKGIREMDNSECMRIVKKYYMNGCNYKDCEKAVEKKRSQMKHMTERDFSRESAAWKNCMTALMNDPVGRTLRGIDAANLCDRKTR